MIMIMTIVIKVNCYYAIKIPRILWCFLKVILFVTLTILYLDECQVTFAIKFAIKYPHVTSGNDVIDNAIIAKLGFFVAATRFHYRVKNK